MMPLFIPCLIINNFVITTKKYLPHTLYPALKKR